MDINEGLVPQDYSRPYFQPFFDVHMITFWTFVHLLTLLYDTLAIVLRAGYTENGGWVGVLVGRIICLRVKDG